MRVTRQGEASALRLLVDSNFVIALEPYAGDIEPAQPLAAEVHRLAAEQGHLLLVHPATRDDLLQGTDLLRREQRLAELKKFPHLIEGPIPSAVTSVLGSATPSSNDHRDLRLIAALHQNAASYLITDDAKLRRRARRIGLGERVLSLTDAAEMLRQLAPSVPNPPPRVRRIPAYALDGDQQIFASLREDYLGFERWLNEVVRPDSDNRDCLVIEQDERYAGLAIVKRHEPDCIYGFPQPVTKIATFKVDADYLGSKYGELLLKAIFASAHDRHAASLYVEVLPKHEGLVALLATFGFNDSGKRTCDNELVLLKRLGSDATGSYSALEYHIAHGPPAILGSGRVFIVPILPEWHAQLFPDTPEIAGQQLTLLSAPELGTHPWGNALRKAYLCNSPTSQIRPGDTLLFYQSHGPSTVAVVGVVEDTLRSTDASEVLAFVERRTVYTPGEIAAMSERVGGVLAILFRQDRFIDPPWTLPELQAARVVNSWPQSITQVRGEGAQWVHDRLTE